MGCEHASVAFFNQSTHLLHTSSHRSVSEADLGLCACSLSELMSRLEELHDEREALVVQLSIANEEKTAAEHATALANAEARQIARLNYLLQVPNITSHFTVTAGRKACGFANGVWTWH